MLTKTEARLFLLAHQGLWPPQQLDGKSGILDFVQRVGCIQFDPLNVVGRNPDLVLQARIRDYQPCMLEELLYQDRRLLDGWDKMMSVYAITDWPFFERERAAARARTRSAEHVKAILPQIRRVITEKGPISSQDLQFEKTVDWPWGPTRLSRAALESMFFWGTLVVHHRVHSRKYYDFSERHVDAALFNAPDPNETAEDYLDWRIERRIGGIGLVWNKSGDAWLGIRGLKAKERAASVKRLVEAGRISELHVDGISAPFLVRNSDRAAWTGVRGATPPLQAAILAPLDNLLWDRRLIQALFGFEYVWEVYKPAAERRFGYYVLPVLYGDRFVARFEPERDKQNAALIIKNWWWEEGADEDDVLLQAEVRLALQRFLKYLGIGKLTVADRVPAWLAGG